MRPSRAGAIVACLLVCACAEQRLHDHNAELLQQGDYESAVDALDIAARQYPNNAQLRSDALLARRAALTQLLADAAAAGNQRRFDDAEKLLNRARRFDAQGQRVDPLLAQLAAERRQLEARDQAEALIARNDLRGASHVVEEALKDNPRQTALRALQRRIELLARQAEPQGRGKLKEGRPITLDFRDASLRTVLEAVTRNSGVNFILDKDLRADARVTLYLHGARVDDALDLIASTNQLARKTIDDQTVLIYPDTPEKQRDYQEQVVRVFYLSSVEAKTAAAYLKTLLKLHDPFIDERVNLLALRDTPENIELAERLLALYDTADPEVTLDLQVLEVGSTRLTELGVQFPNSVTLTPIPPANAANGLTLGNIRSLTRGDIGVDVGNLVLNLRREVGDTRTLANPSVRVRSKDKAKVMVGDKVPVITTTTGQAGFVSDSVSYLDVGLQLEVEPTVYADDDVAIKVGLEVSSVTGQVKTANGTLAYQIGTRNATTTLRLHDGETQLLGGLISHDERNTSTRVPGLGDLPIAGRLFSSDLVNGGHTELVLAVTPHVLRNVRRPDAGDAELWIGTESAPRLRGVANRMPVGVGAGAPAPSAPATIPGASSVDVPPAPPDASPALPASNVNALHLAGPASVKPGEVFRVTVDLESTAGLRGLPLQIAYDKDRLRLLLVEEGGFFGQGGGKTSFTQTIEADRGVARVGVLRDAATVASGKGPVVALEFKALAPGAASVSLVGANAITLGDAAAPTLPPPLSIKVE